MIKHNNTSHYNNQSDGWWFTYTKENYIDRYNYFGFEGKNIIIKYRNLKHRTLKEKLSEFLSKFEEI